jgi:hypothetical protein
MIFYHSVGSLFIWEPFLFLCKSFLVSCSPICQSFLLVAEPFNLYLRSHCLCILIPVYCLLFPALASNFRSYINRPLICFELILVQHERHGSSFSFLHANIQFSLQHFSKTLSFLHCMFLESLAKIRWA